ncbi:MAG: site-specific integrase, partial [Nitrospirota bacterium]
LTLRWEDIDMARKLLSVSASYAKSGQTRSVPMNSLVLAALTRLPRHSDYVFAKPNGMPFRVVQGFRAACRRAGLHDVTPHTLRHTFATRLIENGVDLRTVQELGGWSNLKMLERYGHVTPSRKAEAVERLVPPKVPALERRKLVTA